MSSGAQAAAAAVMTGRSPADCELSVCVEGIYICTMCGEPCVWDATVTPKEGP